MGERAYHKIFDGKTRVGYTSPSVDMPGVWSVYNKDAKKIAMVAPMEDMFNVMFYGRNQTATDQWLTTKSFKIAVARIFKMEGLPKFDPPLAKVELGAISSSESAALARAKSEPAESTAPAASKPDPYEARATALVRKILRTCHTDDARRKTLDAFSAEAARLKSGAAAPSKSNPYETMAKALLTKILESVSINDRATTLDALATVAKSQRARY